MAIALELRCIFMADDLEKQFQKTLQSLNKISYEATQKGLKVAAEETVKIMSAATNPKSGTGAFKRGWKIKRYPNKAFIYNVRKGGRMPMTNIAEYSSRGPKPFIKLTEKANENRIRNVLIKKIELEIRRKK